MQKHVVVTRQQIRNHVITAFAFGIVAAMFAWMLWSMNVVSDQAIADSNENKIVSGCRLPDVNGAMTVFIMEDNKIKCWRWK